MSALRLVCLPHALGSAAFYRRWSESLPEWVEVWALDFPSPGFDPGGLQRMDIGMLVKQLAGEYAGAEWQPFVLFGHGLGGLLAFELAHWLRLSGQGEPLALLVSGIAAPSRCDSWHPLSDTWLPEPKDVHLGESDRGAFAPIPVSYEYRRRAPLRASIHVLGRRQGGIRSETLLEWQQETCGDFSLDLLERHHFFIQQQEARTLRLVCRYCERHLRRWRPESQCAVG